MPEIKEQLSKTDDGTDNQDLIAEKIANPDAKTEEKSEEQQNEIQLTEQALKEFEELGYSQEELEFFEPDELRNILKKELKKEKKEDKQQEPSVPLVTEELAKGGFAKNFIGQPVSVLIEALDEQNKYISELKENKPIKKETKESLDEIDFLELKPKEQLEAVNTIVQNALAENDKKWEDRLNGITQTIKPVAEQKAMDDLLIAVQKKLPEGLKASNVFDDWMKNSGLSKDAKIALGQSLEALSESVASFGLVRHANETKKKEEDELKKKSKITMYNQIKKKLKETDNTAVDGSTFNASQRTKGVYRDERTDEIVRKIIERQT